MPDLQNLTRNPDRRSTDRSRLDALLDEVLVATVCTTIETQPWCLPVFFARDYDQILIHGSTGAGMLHHLSQGAEAALAVHVLDGIVVAQTAFESSANYRSAVIRGRFDRVANRDEALEILTDRLIPGRSREVPPNVAKELAATLVLSLQIRPGSPSARINRCTVQRAMRCPSRLRADALPVAGEVGALVHCAGYGTFAPVELTSPAEAHRQLQVNLISAAELN